MGNTVEEKGLEVFGTKEVSVKEFMGGTDKSLMLLENPELAKENLIALRQKHEARVEELIFVEILSPAELKELNSIRGELREPRYLVQKIEKNNISVFEAYKKTDKANLKDLIEINKSLEDKADEKIKADEERKKNEKAEEEKKEQIRIDAIKAKIESIETESFAIIQKMTFQNVIPDGAAIGLICKQEFDFEEYDILFEQTLARIENAIKDKIDDLNEREEQRIAREQAEEENRKLKAKQELQSKRLNEIMPYVAFGEAVDLTNLSDIEESAYSEILSSKKALFEADAKEKQEAQDKLDAENLERENKAKADKEKVFEIRKGRLAEIGFETTEDLKLFFHKEFQSICFGADDVFNSDTIDFENIITDSKLLIEKFQSDAEEAEVQKAKDLELSKADALKLQKENKARVNRLANDKKIISESLPTFFAELHLVTENKEIADFIENANVRIQSLKNELLTELEKL